MSGQGETVTVNASQGSTTFKTTTMVGCFVDVYPFEGNSFSLTDAQILSCTVEKNIKADQGSFRIVLAPQTLAGYQSWAQIITPMSFVVIGMSRGDHSEIVMMGIVNSISEPEKWQSGQSVQRAVILEGADISYFFTMSDYYSAWFLAVSGDATISIISPGLLQGNPGSIGETWFKQIMSAAFGKTYVPYKSGQITFPQLIGTQFDDYPTFIPYGEYFIGANGTWMQKFRKIFPFPIYEFFVTTVQSGNYGTAGGTPVSSNGQGSGVTAGAAMIARLNPLPKLVSSAGADGTASFDSIDVSDWNGLPNFDLEGVGYVEKEVGFTDAEVLNFFNINPVWLNGLNGVSNSNIVMGTLLFTYALDLASIGRYGYRPLSFDVPWFSDPSGQAAKETTKQQVFNSFARVLGELAGYYEAAPLMGKSQVSTWLRPDIQIGCKFTYQAFRTNEDWDFYIEGVTHNYVMGGESTTTLLLTRGLPHSVYNDSGAGGVLYNIHIGNAQKVNGVYQTGLPDGSQKPLQAFTPTQFADLVATLNNLFTQPQGIVTQQGGNPTGP